MRNIFALALALVFVVTGARAYNEQPAFTGDVTKPAGSTATTVTGINGASVPTSAPLLSTNSSGQPISTNLGALGGSLNYVTKRVPTTLDDTNAAFAAGNFWTLNNDTWLNLSNSAAFSDWQPQLRSSAALCDLIAGCQGAYGVIRLKAAYAGNAFTVTRASDSTTLNVGFDANGVALWSTVDPFCSGTTCGVSTWYDQSGNGYDLTQATQANMPQIFGSHVGAYRSITFNGQTTGKWLKNTALPISNNQALTVLLTARQGSVNSTYMEMFDIGNPTQISAVYVGPGSGQITFSDTGNNNQTTLSPPLRDAVYVFQNNGSTQTASINNLSTSTAGANTTASTGIQIGAYGSSATLPAWDDVTSFVVYNSVVSAGNLQKLKQAAYQTLGISPQVNDVLALFGDSITALAPTSINIPNDATWPNQVQAHLDRPYNVYNFGFSGYTCNQLQSNTSYVTAVYKAGVNNIANVECATNDINGGATNSAIYGYVTNICATFHSAGFKCIIDTVLPRNATTGTFETQRLAYNTYVRANYKAMNGDAIADIGGDPVIGTATTYLTTAYSVDNTHPTSPLGASYIADDIAAAVKGLLP